MKIQDLLKELRFVDSETSQIKDSNPKQIISTELRVPVWRIKYSYLTARNNEREVPIQSHIQRQNSGYELYRGFVFRA